jgi:hypothetical protein
MVSQARPSAGLVARQSAAAAAPPAAPVPVPQSPPEPEFIGNGHQPFAMTPAPSLSPTTAAPSGANPFALPDDQPDLTVVPRYKTRRESSLGMQLLVVGLLLIVAGGSVGGLYYARPDLFRKATSADGGTASNDKNADSENVPTPTKKTDLPSQAAAGFPRRILGISVNNYLYANPTSYGIDTSKSPINHDFGRVIRLIADKLRIPKDQVFELSDGAPGAAAKPTLKPIIESTITQFLETCRPQDRIMFVFTGHAIELEKELFLVPLEGDLDDKKTLIPLKSVMDQLEKCRAQQKVFLVDVCRYDPARGFERPAGGMMPPALEAALKNPPPGVQVWSACSAGQYSFEYDDDTADGTADGISVKGGLMLNAFFYAFMQGSPIQKPEDPLPIDIVFKRVSEKTRDVAKRNSNADQIAFLVGQPKTDAIPYDPSEPIAQAVKIPGPEKFFAGGLAKTTDIRDLFDEVSVPGVKAARQTESVLRLESIVPFTQTAMKDYAPDGVSVDDVMKEPDKYPIRTATIESIRLLRAFRERDSELALPESLSRPEVENESFVTQTLPRLQRGPARVMKDLRETIEKMEKAAEFRKDEKSKRWLAHYDYVMSQLKARLAYVHEYSLMIGKVRLKRLPDMEKQPEGWRMASAEKMASPTDVVDLVKESRKLLGKLVKEHPSTPWEVLARRERFATLGLEWQAYGLGKAKPEEMPKKN